MARACTRTSSRSGSYEPEQQSGRIWLAFEEGKLREEVCTTRIEELSKEVASLDSRRSDLIEEISETPLKLPDPDELSKIREKVQRSLENGALPSARGRCRLLWPRSRCGTARTSSRSSAYRFFDHRMDRCPREDSNLRHPV